MITKLPFDTDEPQIGTALVRIDPAGDPRVHKLGMEVAELVQRAEARTVTSDADKRVAADDLLTLKGLMEAFEDRRKEFTGPLNAYLKDINNEFKEFTAPLERANALNRGKILAYDAEQKRIREEEERINRLRMEAAQAEMKLKGELTESVNLVEITPEPPAHTRTPQGMMGKRTVKKWRVTDLALVPDQYKLLNEPLIGQLVRKGIPSIPGIEIYEEETLVLTGAR